MRWLIAFALAAHGIAHGVGFAVNWHIISTPELPFSTTVFAGRWNVGVEGIRLVGLLWLVAGGACLTAAAALAGGAPWSIGATIAALVLSLAMCAVGWPAARIGVYLNLGLGLALIVSALLGLGWFPTATTEASHVASNNSLPR
jgi:hypothetical protein